MLKVEGWLEELAQVLVPSNEFRSKEERADLQQQV